jgi:hypothetical protein
MKKRIFSILLVAIMLLSLALVSCNDDPPEDPPIPTVVTPTGEVIPTESVLGKFEYSAEDPAKIELGEKVSFSDKDFTRYSSYGKSIVYTKEIKDAEGNHVVSNEWHIFFPSTGKSVKFTTPVLKGDETDEQKASMITDISFSSESILGTSFVSVVLTYGEGADKKYEIFLYDETA